MNILSYRLGVRAAGTALAAALLATACSSGGSDDPEDRSGGDPPRAGAESSPVAETYPGLPEELAQQRLAWERCPEPSTLQGADSGRPGSVEDGTPWECATLTVPLDYERPEGETIGIALIRVATSAPEEERIGSLVFNFGGPGGSGVTTLPSAAEDYESLREGGFDLVSFDPRGVGESAGVVCFDADTLDELSQQEPPPPDTPEGRAAYEELDAEYVAACQENSGEVLPHVGTVNAARDMDLLRHALGDERLHYFGISYGTELGGVYAHLFPERVGRTVLDAVVDPTGDPVEQSLQQIEGFQLALEHYLEWCAEQAGCPVGDDPAAGEQAIVDLLDALEEQPLPTEDPDGRELTADLALTGITATLYSEESWEYLSLGLQEALLAGAGNALLGFADIYSGRDNEGEYSNQSPAFTAIRCADSPFGMSYEEAAEWQDEFTAASPVFGPDHVWGITGCEGWPVEGLSENPEVSVEGDAEPILLVGTTGDPATPYVGAAHMQEAMGGPEVAPLLTLDGEGHGAYNSGNDCVTEAVNAHLLAGETPADGTVCD